MVRRATLVAQAGTFPVGAAQIPTIPAINATSVLVPRVAALAPLGKETLAASSRDIYEGFHYGGVGTPTTAALAQAVARLEGGRFAALTPSGQSAIATILSALLRPGDHLLVVDTVTYTTRWYLDRILKRGGIDVTYYAPERRFDISTMVQPTTKAIFLESPGSFTFEVQDIRAVAQVARNCGVVSILDNTWAASCFLDPFAGGVDVSVLSLTKYHAGIAGVSLGAIVTDRLDLYEAVREEAALAGLYVSPDVCAQASLAMSTLEARLGHQEASTQIVLDGLNRHPKLRALLHPSRPDHMGHAFWCRDFAGGNSLVSLAFREGERDAVEAIVDRFRLIRIGYGWGGAVSLVTIFEANAGRTVSRAPVSGTCLRLYIGLEDPADVLADLQQALDGGGAS